MRLLKISSVFVFFALCFPLFSSETDATQAVQYSNSVSGNSMFHFEKAGGLQSGNNHAYESNLFSHSLFAGKAVYRRSSGLTGKQKAGVAVLTIGLTFFVTGLIFLITSLSYSYYINQNGNTKNYDEYIKGQNVSRGLFYASMATMGTGAVFIVVSIPLLVESKRRR